MIIRDNRNPINTGELEHIEYFKFNQEELIVNTKQLL